MLSITDQRSSNKRDGKEWRKKSDSLKNKNLKESHDSLPADVVLTKRFKTIHQEDYLMNTSEKDRKIQDKSGDLFFFNIILISTFRRKRARIF